MGNPGRIRRMSSGKQFEYYSLDTKAGFALLSDAQEIVLDEQTGYVVLIDWANRLLIVGTMLAPQEIPLVILLFDRWPSYVPYEHLMQLLADSVSEETPIQVALAVEEAREAGTLDRVLEPLRSLLSSCNERLSLLGLQATETIGYGYRITVTPGRRVAHEGKTQS